jgi:hypothetical protein
VSPAAARAVGRDVSSVELGELLGAERGAVGAPTSEWSTPRPSRDPERFGDALEASLNYLAWIPFGFAVALIPMFWIANAAWSAAGHQGFALSWWLVGSAVIGCIPAVLGCIAAFVSSART